MVTVGTEGNDGCRWRQSQQDSDECGWIERERKESRMTPWFFALSNQANDDEYVLRWEGLRLRRNGKNFVLAK